MRVRTQTRFKTSSGSHERALETAKHIFYVNFKEGDNTNSVVMLDRKMNVVSENEAAYIALMDEIEVGYSWISKKLRNHLEIQ